MAAFATALTGLLRSHALSDAPSGDPVTEIESEDLPPLEVGLAQALAAKVSETVSAAAKAAPGRRASARSKTLVARRVQPNWLPKYEVMDDYSYLVWDEAMTILDRILVYPFTTSYRKHLVSAPKEVISAWQFHSHSLRVGELYIVLDRSLALLEFLTVVAEDSGLPVTDQRKAFEKAFRKIFDSRLRERHRLTHAHERPSMTSRIIDLSGGKCSGEEASALKDFMEGMMTDMMRKLSEVSEAKGRTPPKTLQEVEALHEFGALQEARQMLRLVGEALLGTINEASVAR